jgi:hypothetical protein
MPIRLRDDKFAIGCTQARLVMGVKALLKQPCAHRFWRGAASAVIAEIARLKRALFRGSRISDGTDASGSGCVGTPLTGVKRHGQRRAEEAR